MLRSLAEGGEFARHVHGRLAAHWIPGIVASMRVAAAVGDAEPAPVHTDLGGWFTHSLPLMVRMLLLPMNPVVDFRVPRDALVEQTVWFVLRGLGLKAAVIRRHYNKRALAFLGATPEVT